LYTKRSTVQVRRKGEGSVPMLGSYKNVHSFEKVDAHISRAKNIVVEALAFFSVRQSSEEKLDPPCPPYVRL